jgi:hypothetical protein
MIAVRRPTGPEDLTPGPEVGLTHDQYEQLVRFVPRPHYSLRLRDRGAAYVEVELLDPEGDVSESMLLYPQQTQRCKGHAFTRWLRRHDP